MQSSEGDSIEVLLKKCADMAQRRATDFAKGGFSQKEKPDQTWVTEADLSIEKELRSMISTAFPHHRILGEEEGGKLGEKGITWVLDPIDGTFSFVNRVPFYSSLIAVCEDGVPIMGSATLPAMGWTLFGRQGHGAFVNEKRVHARSLPLREQGGSEIISIADPYRFRTTGRSEVLEQLISEPYRTRVYPDALGYYLLLNGAVRSFVDPRTEIWDTAPFHVILQEAGFRLTDWQGHEGLRPGAVVSDRHDDPANDVRALLEGFEKSSRPMGRD